MQLSLFANVLGLGSVGSDFKLGILATFYTWHKPVEGLIAALWFGQPPVSWHGATRIILYCTVGAKGQNACSYD